MEWNEIEMNRKYQKASKIVRVVLLHVNGFYYIYVGIWQDIKYISYYRSRLKTRGERDLGAFIAHMWISKLVPFLKFSRESFSQVLRAPSVSLQLALSLEVFSSKPTQTKVLSEISPGCGSNQQWVWEVGRTNQSVPNWG